MAIQLQPARPLRNAGSGRGFAGLDSRSRAGRPNRSDIARPRPHHLDRIRIQASVGGLWQYSYNLRGLYETPALAEDSPDWTPDRALVAQIVRTSRDHGRTILTESESKQVLAAYGIPTAATIIAADAAAAVQAAVRIGYPVVLKLYSETITHKTDVGGVQLNLGNAQAVENAFAAIQTSVSEKAGAEHFQGVTVQPMVRLK